RKAGGLASACHHPLIAGHAKRCQALGREYVHAAQALRDLTLQLAQCPQFLRPKRMHARQAALGATYMQLADLKVDIPCAPRPWISAERGATSNALPCICQISQRASPHTKHDLAGLVGRSEK